MLDALVAVALSAAPGPPPVPRDLADLPAWCHHAATVDRSTAPDGAQWALCQTEDPFGEDRAYVRESPTGTWVMPQIRGGFRGASPLLAVDAEHCLVGGAALVLLTPQGDRVLVEWDGTSFNRPTSLGRGRYAVHRNDGREWRGTVSGRWRSYAGETS